MCFCFETDRAVKLYWHVLSAKVHMNSVKYSGYAVNRNHIHIQYIFKFTVQLDFSNVILSR